MILEELSTYAKVRVAADKKVLSLKDLKIKVNHLPKGDFRFENALKRKSIAIICEVKKASPSKGIISEDFPFVRIAKEFEHSGADCLSVLTEPKWFLGSDEILKEIRSAVTLPILRKDFTIDDYQIYQAKLLGADAILLICSLLDTPVLKHYLAICNQLGLSALVEAHNKDEIISAIAAGARMIGVNNRNLKDFTVDLSNSVNLRNTIPKDILFVAESGILTVNDAINLIKIGADALLIGEAMMKSEDKKAFIDEIKREGSIYEN
ncbi:indole-3-glycerol phosphate synthase [Carnobacterium iners]|uniref:Indole-3-glycerol phosphate synthase n=1 Tax=Carnobacterium iners TaxID=1073423 RepID=A0A1X7MP33_9LACT|nr:indole-3-glycerol phosphate synthase TrpC [Carnobacterium iners]SEK95126.1 indole-3-glycerol phosphate synthase [Carnobacterium iners]SMH26592.1 indole-3-glycerol phosphate synthase [Carnobacterium iners]